MACIMHAAYSVGDKFGLSKAAYEDDCNLA